MAVEYTGYTIQVHSSDGEDLMVCQMAGYSVAADRADYENWLWSVADSMASFAEGQAPSITWTPIVIRHEKEDITLTHP